jgi:hypothetical protein
MSTNAFAFKAYRSMPFKYCTQEKRMNIKGILTELNIPKNLIRKKRFWKNIIKENRHIEDLESIAINQPVYVFIPKKYRKNINFTPLNISPGEIQTQYYVVKDGDNFKHRILFKKMELPYNVLDNFDYLKKMISWNPTITDMNHLEPGDQIYVEYPKIYSQKCRVQDKNTEVIRKVASTNTSRLNRNSTILTSEFNDIIAKFNYGMFLGISVGNLKDDSATESISISQNSPLTIGGNFNIKSSNSISYNGSVYVSKYSGFLLPSGEVLTPKPEIGFTLYRSHFNDILSLYYGLDYESLSKLNLNTSNSGDQSSSLQSLDIGYATFGISKGVQLLGSNYFFKLGLSQSISSNSYTGNKVILFAYKPITDKWGINAFVKKQTLKQNSYLEISRTGVGISYSF